MTDKFIKDQLARDGNNAKQPSSTSGSTGAQETQHTGSVRNKAPKSMLASM